ncbi:hypothetical protein DFH27DRAFT_617756 [Peziza echinospora]|nr:hypothetical protein DFH27DRAFT_617756 [Peziza echinospora]
MPSELTFTSAALPFNAQVVIFPILTVGTVFSKSWGKFTHVQRLTNSSLRLWNSETFCCETNQLLNKVVPQQATASSVDTLTVKMPRPGRHGWSLQQQPVGETDSVRAEGITSVVCDDDEDNEYTAADDVHQPDWDSVCKNVSLGYKQCRLLVSN